MSWESKADMLQDWGLSLPRAPVLYKGPFWRTLPGLSMLGPLFLAGGGILDEEKSYMQSRYIVPLK